MGPAEKPVKPPISGPGQAERSEPVPGQAAWGQPCVCTAACRAAPAGELETVRGAGPACVTCLQWVQPTELVPAVLV